MGEAKAACRAEVKRRRKALGEGVKSFHHEETFKHKVTKKKSFNTECRSLGVF